MKKEENMRIESYSFGSMKVGGKVYDEDLIIFPERVKSGWWRREGHSLAIEDLEEVLDYNPEVLIIGTGAWGCLQIPSSTKKLIKKENIELIERNTEEALRRLRKAKR